MRVAPDNIQRYRMTIAYDGTNYLGWQTQPKHPTVQAEIERVLKQLTGGDVRVHSSGRTDTGVHAKGQVAHFDLEKRPEPRRLLLGLNSLLPSDIRVLALRRAKKDFHARYGAVEKEYRYLIWNDPILPPEIRLYRTWIRRPLDIAAMRSGAAALVGRHDFAAFAATPAHPVERGTVRELYDLSILKRGKDIVLVARGNGFLYKMVRSLAGFLIRVGKGELEPGAAATILASGVRTACVPTAAPQGLFLWKVTY